MTARITPISIALIAVYYMVSLLYFGTWKTAAQTADAWGYHVYLPAFFWDKDIAKLDNQIALRRKLENNFSYDSTANSLHPYSEFTPAPKTGNVVIKYTMGVALMQLPFWATANVVGRVGGFEAKPEGSIYQLSICLAAIFYIFVGIYYLKRVLEEYFSKKIVLLTIIWLALTTNLFQFGTSGNVMAHAFQFFWVSLLIFWTKKWHQEPTMYRALKIGLALGFITLIRPNEILFSLIPILWGISDKETFSQKIKLLTQHKVQLLAAFACLIFIFSFQIIYWKTIAGEWLFDSYPKEHFNVLDPHIIEGLFSQTNGLFYYSPTVLLSFLGVLWLKKYAKPLSILWYILLPIFTYITYSWWCWWYEGAYGSRPFVELLPLLAFSFAAFAEKISSFKLLPVILTLLLSFFAWQNFQLQHQVSNTYLQTAITSIYYTKGLFLKQKWTEQDIIAIETGTSQPQNLKFKRLLSSQFQDTIVTIDKEFAGNIVYNAPPNDLKMLTWLRFSVEALATENVANRYKQAGLVATAELNGTSIFWKSIHIEDKIGTDKQNRNVWDVGKTNEWGEASFFVQLPANKATNYTLKLCVWNIGKHKNMRIRNLKIEEWE